MKRKTINEFTKGKGITFIDEVKYKGRNYKIMALDLQEDLIAINEFEDEELLCWKRVESFDEFICNR